MYGTSISEHVGHLAQDLSCLAINNFFIKLSKCVFSQDTVDYLGHIVSSGGVRADPQRIEAMVQWPQPTSIQQLHGFLGLTGYYHRFIRGYASIGAPLTDLLCKDSFVWTAGAFTAFEALKHAMVNAPVLQLLNFDLDFIVENDACKTGIGVVLIQRSQPIAFFSKKLGPKMQAASTYLKELHTIAVGYVSINLDHHGRTQSIILMEKKTENYIPDLESMDIFFDAEPMKTCKENRPQDLKIFSQTTLDETGLMRMSLMDLRKPYVRIVYPLGFERDLSLLYIEF